MKSRIRYCVRNWIVEGSVLSLPFGLSVHFVCLVGSMWCHIVFRRSRNQNVSLCSFGNSFEYSWYRDVNKLNGHLFFPSCVTRPTLFDVKEEIARGILNVACHVVPYCRSLWSLLSLLYTFDPFIFLIKPSPLSPCCRRLYGATSCWTVSLPVVHWLLLLYSWMTHLILEIS